MDEQVQGEVSVTSNVVDFTEATIGARFLAALFDLVVIPIVLGVLFGLIFFAASPGLRNVVLVFVNIAWTCLRDLKGGAGPGKRMAKIKVVSCANGETPTLKQLIIRNLLIWVPFVLLIGFFVEAFVVFALKKERIGDRLAKCKVVVA